MKEFIKQNLAVLLAFTLPIILIITVALITYLPSLFLSTDYNFVYSTCTEGSSYIQSRCDSNPQKHYSITSNKLVVNSNIDESFTFRIFLHDTKKNESREISLEEAQKLELNGLLTSPDGITISSSYDRGSDFFPFSDDGSSYGYYLTKGKSRSKLNLINRDARDYYRDNFRFIGWVLPEKN